jgi:hypothetical protein
MDNSLEVRVNSWNGALKDITKHFAAVSLYALSLFGTQIAIAPSKAHSYSLVELLQYMDNKGNFDRFRDPVYVLADEGDELSTRTDVDHPAERDVVIGWNDAQQNERGPGSYHIYSKNRGSTQTSSQWGNFIGSVSLDSSQLVYRVNGDSGGVQSSENRSGVNGSDTMQDGDYVFTVVYVPDSGSFEMIGENQHGFIYRTDPNEPRRNPTPQPSPSRTATNISYPTSTQTPTPSPTPSNTPTYSPTPTSTGTNTPIPSPTPSSTLTTTYTTTPTSTPVPPTATPTVTPTPELDIRIQGYVDTLISDDNQAEGEAVAGTTVSLIPVLYSPSNVRNEPAIGGIEVFTNSNGEYDLRIPLSITDQFQEARLRITGADHIDRVGPIIRIQDYSFSKDEKMDDVIPDGFNIAAYNHIFRSNVSIQYNGENVNIQQKLRPDIPFTILEAPAQKSGYNPTETEKNIYLKIINEELPEVTKGGIPPDTGYLVHSINEAPWFSILGFWNDSNHVYGSAGITLTEDYNPHLITQAEFSVNTIQKIKEKEPSLSDNEAVDWYTRIARQEIGTMAGAVRPYFPGDPGRLQGRETVFHETQAAQNFTKFDQDSLYITYVRDQIATPGDLNVTLKKYTPLQQ